MSNPNALFLLADHIKLSLLERKRAKSLSLDADSQDGHISRSLDQFREGLESLEREQKRLEEAGDGSKALTIADALPSLKKQLGDLTSQFHGFSTPSSSSTLNHPNDPSLAADFKEASTIPPAAGTGAGSSAHQQQQPPPKKSLRTGSGPAAAPPNPKSVRFSDASADPLSSSTAAAAKQQSRPQGFVGGDADDDRDLEAARSGLFGGLSPSQPYRDDPDAAPTYRDGVEARGLTNVQIHDYHRSVMEEQDAQLDALGESIGRQRELSMQIGDELDSHVAMLDESERIIDRHQSGLDRARRQVGRVSRAAGESKQMIAIVVLIVILVLLIAILK